jgi:hypothetical protein
MDAISQPGKRWTTHCRRPRPLPDARRVRPGGRGQVRARGFLRRYGPRCAFRRALAAGRAAPRRPHPEGTRSALAEQADPVSSVFSPLCHPEAPDGSPGPSAARPEALMSHITGMSPEPARRVRMLSPAENIAPICSERSGKAASRSCILVLARPCRR